MERKKAFEIRDVAYDLAVELESLEKLLELLETAVTGQAGDMEALANSLHVVYRYLAMIKEAHVAKIIELSDADIQTITHTKMT